MKRLKLDKVINHYDKSFVHLSRHCNEVTRENTAVWAKTGETLAVRIVGDY